MLERSTEINELATALAVAQGQIEGAIKDSSNPFFKSKYADLAAVWDAIRVPLSLNGLSIMQLPSADGPKVTITTILAHKSGQWIQSALTMTAKEDTPQAVGSAITYARRYALQSIAGVAPEDDDGETAQGRPQPNQTGQWAKNNQPKPAPQSISKDKLASATGDPKTGPAKEEKRNGVPVFADWLEAEASKHWGDNWLDVAGKLYQISESGAYREVQRQTNK